MKILFEKHLCPREFGSAVFNVPDLLKWAKEKGFHLATVPPLDDYGFAQVECVLSLIANSPLPNSTADEAAHEAAHEAAAKEAAAHVATKPTLAQHPTAESAPVFLVGADAENQWRVVLSKAIANGELVLLDRYSFLPVAIAAAPAKGEAGAGTTTAPAAKAGTNKKKWGDAELRALWEESIMPGVTTISLATKHGVTRQRIASLLKTAKGKFSTTRTHSGVKNSYGQLIK